jgi:glutamine amidotransferase
VVDHGAGNIRSVVRALTHIGARVTVSHDPAEVAAAERIVLPGQGAFGDCMTRLRATGLEDVVKAHIAADKPYLGICLGLQVLFETGLEHGEHQGLGVLPGVCRHIEERPEIKVPHMGWNTANHDGDAALHAVVRGEWYYFVHSYVVEPAGPLACAWTTHGERFVSAVARGNLLAVQFHPEKSDVAGLKLMESFLS